MPAINLLARLVIYLTLREWRDAGLFSSLDEKIGISLLMLASFNTATLIPGHQDLKGCHCVSVHSIWMCQNMPNGHTHTYTNTSISLLKGSLVWQRFCSDIPPPVDRALPSPLLYICMCAWAVWWICVQPQQYESAALMYIWNESPERKYPSQRLKRFAQCISEGFCVQILFWAWDLGKHIHLAMHGVNKFVDCICKDTQLLCVFMCSSKGSK